MRRIVLLVALLLCMTFANAQTEKKRIAVLDFDFSAVQKWWEHNWDVGQGISDLIIKELVRDGSFRVVERQALNAVIAEQNFSNSDRANPSTAANLGKVLGVDAIIVGTVTQFGTEKKNMSIGGLAGKWGGFGRGKVGTSEGKAVVAVDARIVDIESAEILAVADGMGESSRSGLLLGGYGSGGGGFGGGNIDMSSSNYRETILGEATHAAVSDLALDLIDAKDRLPVRESKINGLVAYAQGGLIILNVGTSQGVSDGDELSVERVTQAIKDPATGKVLRELTEVVARIRVTKADEGSSEATVISGSGEIQVGDVVKN